MVNTIRFCKGPIKPEELETASDKATYERHMFVWAAMGTMAWSVVELLQQCQSHKNYKHLDHLYRALVELQEIGMVRTDENVMLEMVCKRMHRIIDGAFSFEDIRVHDNVMSVKFGGHGSRWMMALFANAAHDLTRGITNSLEMVFKRPDSVDAYTVTATRLFGKSPMLQRREVLDAIKSLVDTGATSEQLQAILDSQDPKIDAPGVAQWPESFANDSRTGHLVYRGDSLCCTRCNAVEKMAFPTRDPQMQIGPFIEIHQRCLPAEATAGDLLRAIREEPRPKCTDCNDTGRYYDASSHCSRDCDCPAARK